MSVAEQQWLSTQPPTHHVIPHRVRKLAEYPTRQTWAGVESPSDHPAGFINCDGDGHVHDGAFVCKDCTKELIRHLTDIPALVRDLQVALVKDVRFVQRGAVARGPVSEDEGKQEEAPVNFNIRARTALKQLRLAMPWASPAEMVQAKQNPEFIALAAVRVRRNVKDRLRQPDANDWAGQVSRACMQARQVMDTPREVIFYGICPNCSGDIYQERVDKYDKSAVIVCQHGCGYVEQYKMHEQNALNGGDDRWLTIDQLVGAIEAADEVVTRKQIKGWAARDGLPRETRNVPTLSNEGGLTSTEIYVYRLGDVRAMAAEEELDRKSKTTQQVAEMLGVTPDAIRKMVERGQLVPNKPGAKPLKFTLEALRIGMRKSA